MQATPPRYLPDTVIPAGNLGYYTYNVPVKSLFAAPISQGERTVGVLVVDSLERDAFSPDNQDLLTRFAPFFCQIIEKIRISQELDLRAKNFAALHEMSSILNSSLEITEVLDRLSDGRFLALADITDRDTYGTWFCGPTIRQVVDAREKSPPTIDPVAVTDGRYWWIFYHQKKELKWLLVVKAVPTRPPE